MTNPIRNIEENVYSEQLCLACNYEVMVHGSVTLNQVSNIVILILTTCVYAVLVRSENSYHMFYNPL